MIEEVDMKDDIESEVAMDELRGSVSPKRRKVLVRKLRLKSINMTKR